MSCIASLSDMKSFLGLSFNIELEIWYRGINLGYGRWQNTTLHAGTASSNLYLILHALPQEIQGGTADLRTCHKLVQSHVSSCTELKHTQ